MYPQVEKYLEVLEAAETAREDKRRSKYAATVELEARERAAAPGGLTSQRSSEIWDTYYAAEEELNVEFQAIRKKAEEELKASLEVTDPLAAWLVGGHYWTEYPEETFTLLKSLPQDEAGLRALRAQHQWCNVFHRFLRDAKAAGVVESDPVAVARSALSEYLGGELYISTLRVAMDRADQYAEAKLQAAAERVDKVWAELLERQPAIADQNAAEAFFRAGVTAVLTGEKGDWPF